MPVADVYATKSQVRRIHVVAHALGLEDADRKADMQEVYGVDSSPRLTYSQADTYITHLEDRARSQGIAVPPPPLKRYADLGDRPGMASPAQLRLIEALWAEVSRYKGRDDRHRALCSFLFKRFGRSHPTMIEARQVRQVVAALKTMKTVNKGNR